MISDIYQIVTHFLLQNGKMLELQPSPFSYEKDIQKLVEDNLDTLFKLQRIKSEFSIQGFRFDTLAFEPESNSFVIIEYKNTSSYSVTDQVITYLRTLIENKVDFINIYNEVFSKKLSLDGINWAETKLIIISPTFGKYQKSLAGFPLIPVQLYTITKYQNNIITLDPVVVERKNTSISAFLDKASSMDQSTKARITKEFRPRSPELERKKGNDMIRIAFDHLIEGIQTIESIVIKPTTGYIGLWYKGSNIGRWYVKKKFIQLFLNSKIKVDSIDDPKSQFVLGDSGSRYYCKISNIQVAKDAVETIQKSFAKTET